MDDGTSIVRITKSFLFKPLAFRGLFKKQPEIFKVTVNKCMYTYIHIYIYISWLCKNLFPSNSYCYLLMLYNYSLVTWLPRCIRTIVESGIRQTCVWILISYARLHEYFSPWNLSLELVFLIHKMSIIASIIQGYYVK